MIRSSFVFLDGIGETTEQRLWGRGITTWDEFMSCSSIARISEERKRRYDADLEKAESNLSCCNEAFFSHRLAGSHHWRLYNEFRDYVSFLDIETTGNYAGNKTTVVGIYNSSGYTSLVRGQDLSRESIIEALGDSKLLVTFFGRGFDVPVLESEFGLELPKLHYDLCFAGKKVGLRGGLKSIEHELGISRSDDTTGLDGLDAVRLWGSYRRKGDLGALETLVQYNKEDVVNLVTLADIIFSRLRESATRLFPK